MNPVRHEHLDGRAMAVLVTCSLLWGLNQVAAKLAMPEVPALTQAALRSSGAALLVLAWARWRGVPLFARDGTLPAGLLAGGLFAAEFACIYGGLQFTASSRMAVFIYLAPFVVALGMPLIAPAERLHAPQWAGLLAAFGGVALAFSEGFMAQPGPLGAAPAYPMQWLGDSLGVAAALLWGLTTLTIRATRLGQAPPEKTLAYQLVVSGLLLSAAAVVVGAWPSAPTALGGAAPGGLNTGAAGAMAASSSGLMPWSFAAFARLSPMAVASLIFQTVIVTFASYLAWFWVMRHYPATKISVFVLLTPVAGLAFGVALLGEPLSWRLLVAVACVALGIVLVNRRPA